jgi:hypothetical protein
MMSRKRKAEDIKSRKVAFVSMSLSSKWRISTESHNGFHLKNAYAKAAKQGLEIFVFAR